MPQIRPVSDLRNHFSDISRLVHETAEPLYLTKNGYGDMVVMSMESYEQKRFESEIFSKLREAELEARTNKTRYSHEDIFSQLRSELKKRQGDENV